VCAKIGLRNFVPATCDRKRSGRPLVVDDEQIKSLIESNPHYTTREIAEIIDVSQKTVVNHLHTLGYVSRYDIWVPHNLCDKNLMDRISICDLLLKRNENCPFLKWMITGDEKWIVYNNSNNNTAQKIVGKKR